MAFGFIYKNRDMANNTYMGCCVAKRSSSRDSRFLRKCIPCFYLFIGYLAFHSIFSLFFVVGIN